MCHCTKIWCKDKSIVYNFLLALLVLFQFILVLCFTVADITNDGLFVVMVIALIGSMIILCSSMIANCFMARGYVAHSAKTKTNADETQHEWDELTTIEDGSGDESDLFTHAEKDALKKLNGDKNGKPLQITASSLAESKSKPIIEDVTARTIVPLKKIEPAPILDDLPTMTASESDKEKEEQHISIRDEASVAHAL